MERSEHDRIAHVRDQRGGGVAHRLALVELRPRPFLRQERPAVPQQQLRVDCRAVEALRQLRYERGCDALVDRDRKRDLRIGGRGRRLVDGRLHLRGRPEQVGRDENPRRSEPELDRRVEGLQDRLRRVVGGHPTDADPADEDAARDRSRPVVRPDRGRGHQQGDGRGDEGDAFHVFRLPKIRGSFVMIPSAPAATSS